ncbi:hypothetical protein HYDPIDRAFT_189505 [Hydnomerulius pinastri MD-312]|uniref:DUF6533 domain-containing protein n=1 Tax=Hydnomerulius pinastri MD-312 TaxID=994086 RepID=A0A0C9V7H7_9AGAM|nr:hypothetical protein HYDPIDRAFT_189505 [Hydnomerulius pinastri MD-312]
MASDAVSEYAALQLNDYLSVGILAAISYNYVLTFLQEIEYVWLRPWTSMSTMFLVVRYLGLSMALLQGLGDTSFVYEPVPVRTALYLFTRSASIVFSAVANLVMILRVFAMYNRSRLVLGILLIISILHDMTAIVYLGVYGNPSRSLSVTEIEVGDTLLCSLASTVGQKVNSLFYIPGIVLGVLLCTFALVQFARHSLEMHKALGKWQPNRYMTLLVQEGVLYFVVALYFNIVNLVLLVAPVSWYVGDTLLVLSTLSDIVPYVLAPRLIISMREFHSHVVGEHIDSAFGIGSQRLSHNGLNIMFATPEEVGENAEEGAEDRNGIEETPRGMLE